MAGEIRWSLIIFGGALLLPGLMMCAAAIATSNRRLRYALLFSAAAFAAPGIGVLLVGASLLRQGAALAPFLLRDLSPVLFVMGMLGVFLGTWLLGSAVWWSQQFHSSPRKIRQLAVYLFVLGVLAVAGGTGLLL